MFYFFICLLFLLLLFLLGGSSVLVVWVCLLSSTFLTCLWLLFESALLSLKYFILQEVFTGVCLFSLLLIFSPMGFLFGLWLKLGLPPFHSWFLSLLVKLSDGSWFLTFSKIVPTLFFYLWPSLSIFLLCFALGFSLFFLLGVGSLWSVLFFSGCLNFIWGALVSLFNVFFSFCWILVYFIISFSILYFSGSSFLSLVLVMGLPPSFLFFLKLGLLFLVVQSGLFLLLFLFSTLLLFYKYNLLVEGQSYTVLLYQEFIWGFLFFSLLFFVF